MVENFLFNNDVPEKSRAVAAIIGVEHPGPREREPKKPLIKIQPRGLTEKPFEISGNRVSANPNFSRDDAIPLEEGDQNPYTGANKK